MDGPLQTSFTLLRDAADQDVKAWAVGFATMTG